MYYNVHTYQQSILNQMGTLIAHAYAQANPGGPVISAQKIVDHLKTAVKVRLGFDERVFVQWEILVAGVLKKGVNVSRCALGRNLDRGEGGLALPEVEASSLSTAKDMEGGWPMRQTLSSCPGLQSYVYNNEPSKIKHRWRIVELSCPVHY